MMTKELKKEIERIENEYGKSIEKLTRRYWESVYRSQNLSEEFDVFEDLIIVVNC